jgi:hypothetical protein
VVLLVWFQNLDVESLVINRGSSFRYIKRIEIPFLYWHMGGSLGDYVSWIEILFFISWIFVYSGARWEQIVTWEIVNTLC